MIAIVGVDLLFYFYHRIAHRVRLIWATHQAHHSSQYFNFATALRQKWNNSGEILMWIPLPLLGVPPWMVFASFSINLVYQFWIHTERIGQALAAFRIRLQHAVASPGAPRHGPAVPGQELRRHPDHLGPDVRHVPAPRLFRPHYGLTKPVDTFNIWKLQTHEYVAIGRDVRAARGDAGQARLRLRPAGLGARGDRAPATAAGVRIPIGAR